MTIQPITNPTNLSLDLISSLQKIPYKFFENLCSNLNYQDMTKFVFTCKTVQQINSDFKEKYPKTYDKLITKVLSNSNSDLGEAMIDFCSNTNLLSLNNLRQRPGKNLSGMEMTQYCKLQFLELKDILDFFQISGKSHVVDREKLEKAFSCAYENDEADMVYLFVKSSVFHSISTDCLNKLFANLSRRRWSMTIQILIHSNRFKEISPESLGKALSRAASFGRPEIIQTILESEQAHKIGTQDFSRACYYAGHNIKNTKKNIYAESEQMAREEKTLHILREYPLFSNISKEHLSHSRRFIPSTLIEWIDSILTN